ncbi:TorD/DmsD family molecular chaperone [Dethiosulfatarculus sandiegensis]|uniref:Molecular chaperone TorD n=1 Tax=Dethiosulfatarculus sandiegensis TaxID=1429043 RepID=A0A0D2HZM2_9BACT|nr:molecular chaperone TorD family protein [Dethiosulfatarculus sandiegensis]KIX15733.1 hypothetical protein X474_02840 [Dethiosulfatarculus sandiegensis]
MDAVCERIEMVDAGIRGNLYNGLSRALNYPDADLVADLCSGSYCSFMAEAIKELGMDALAARTMALGKCYSESDLSAAEQLLRLEREYTRMCFSSKPRQVYLFESVYKEGKLLQESTFQIARLYYDAGLKVEEHFQLPPDHIAVELEFMAYLCFHEAKSNGNNDKERKQYANSLQRIVLESHLGPFSRAVGEKLAEHADSEFYRLVARTLKELFAQPQGYAGA